MPNPSPLLLIIEDSDEDFAVLKRIGEQASIPCQIDRCLTGDEALDYLLHRIRDCRKAESETAIDRPPLPSLILLDLNLPGIDGVEVLRQINQNAALKAIPIVVLAGNLNPKAIRSLYEQGISGCIVKQVDGIKFRKNIQTFFEYWFVASRLPTQWHET